MNIIRIFEIATILISYLQRSECNATDIVFESLNWRVTCNFRSKRLYEFVCICEQCPHLRQGLKIEMDFNESFTDVWSRQKNEYDFFMEKDERFIELYYERRNYDNKENSFSAEVLLDFLNPPKFPRNVLQSFYVNEELAFGKPLEHYDRNQNVLITRDPNFREFCTPFVNASNIKIKDLGSETHLLFQYRAWKKIRGLILSFTFLENLIEIKSLDFHISRGLHGEWILKDYGQYLDEDYEIEATLILVSDEVIMHPIPSSIILRNELLCGNLTANYPKNFSSGLSGKYPNTFPSDLPGKYHNTSPSDFPGKYPYNSPSDLPDAIPKVDTDIKYAKEGFDHSCNNNSAMLYVVIALNIMFGIYAIVKTYLIMRWKSHYNEIIIYFRNALNRIPDNSNLNRGNCNRFSDPVEGDYEKFGYYESPPLHQRF